MFFLEVNDLLGAGPFSMVKRSFLQAGTYPESPVMLLRVLAIDYCHEPSVYSVCVRVPAGWWSIAARYAGIFRSSKSST